MKPTWLFVLPWPPAHVGGVNRVVMDLAREIQREGRWRPLILVADWRAQRPVWREHHGIATVYWRVRGANPGAKGIRSSLDRWQCKRFRQRFHAFCRDHSVQAINCHYFGDSAHALDAARPVEVPLIVSLHGTDVGTAAADEPTALQRHRALLERCAGVVTPSRDLARRCFEDLGVRRIPTAIHNGIDAEAFEEAAGPLQGDQPPTLVSVGKFERQKGHDLLLQTLALLRRERPTLQLRLIGARAESFEALQALATELGLAEQVQFHTNMPHAQVAKFLRGASAFVLPSRQESFGLVLLEAGCLGVPLIASSVGGVPEVLGDTDNGLLVPPDDVQALADAVRRTLDAPHEAAARAARMRERVLTEFSWARAWRQYRSLVEVRESS